MSSSPQINAFGVAPSTSENLSNGGGDKSRVQRAGEAVKVVLVEWAAYPLERDKEVGAQLVRCGLGRTLEAMKRWDAGLPLEVTVIINRADSPSESTDVVGKARDRLQRMLGIDPQRRVARRMQRYADLRNRYSFIEAVHFRDNRGQDFGAYDFGYRLLQRQGYEGEVLFMNSSVSGPHEANWLQKYREQFHRHDKVGLCGISLNSHDTSRSPEPFAPHVQSYFLFTNMQVLRDAIGPQLLQTNATHKLDVIAEGEIGISARVLDAGYRITSAAFPDFAYRRGDRWLIPYGDQRFRRDVRTRANSI
jgi:hypothetical protein